MKIKFFICLFFISLAVSQSKVSAQQKVGGILLPSTANTGKEKLILNGAGVREKYWMDLYVSGLYLMEKNQDPKMIINGDEPMSIKLYIVSGLITSKKMEDAVAEGFSKSTGGNVGPIKDRIESFSSVFKEEMIKGDIYDIIYTPLEGTVIYKNNKQKIQIKGLDFKQALFGIWLCDEPADEDLKEAMLGR